MHQLEELMRSFEGSGGDRSILANEDIAHLVAGGHRILSMRTVEGLEVKAKETVKGITAHVRVTAAIKNPVHLCFGILHKKGIQEIKMDVVFEAGASATFIAHCIFPKAEKVRHIMDASIRIGENARMGYSEIHYHGPFGGIEVIPKAHVIVGKNGRFSADFSLVTGRVGKLWIDYDVEVGENAVSELTTRIFGHGNDIINIKEKIVLSGENSKGLIKARVAIEDRAQAEVTGITEGNAKGARGACGLS
ncbi:MAG: SufD family Fe-S cluster assembly protein [Candidatus Methanoperedenaceae archaeon]|nr:SufD family Fe-S cluster assembly protein [Candidatus Methanoperedenaceae archaeon]